MPDKMGNLPAFAPLPALHQQYNTALGQKVTARYSKCNENATESGKRIKICEV